MPSPVGRRARRSCRACDACAMPSLSAYAAPHLSLADQLRRAPAFAELPSDRWGCLGLLREDMLFELPAGVEIVSPGDPPALHVVTGGGLREADGGRIWAEGNVLGVPEAVAALPFSTAVRTVAPTLLYRLDGQRFGALLAACPATAARLLSEVEGNAVERGP